MREIKFRGKHVHSLNVNEKYDGRWVYGYLSDKNYINSPELEGEFLIDENTIGQYTGRTDKNGKEIYEGDITELVLPDGEVRHFLVSFKKVIRQVLCHPDFDEEIAKVELNAVCFEWMGYELFPCIDDKGVSDVSKMRVIGNIYENPELLEGVKTE